MRVTATININIDEFNYDEEVLEYIETHNIDIADDKAVCDATVKYYQKNILPKLFKQIEHSTDEEVKVTKFDLEYLCNLPIAKEE